MTSIVDERINASNALHQVLIEAGWIFEQRTPQDVPSRYALKRWVAKIPGAQVEYERWSLEAVLMLCAEHEIGLVLQRETA